MIQTVVFLTFAVAVFVGVQRLLLWYSLKDVTYHARCSHLMVEPGQIFTIESELTNAKRMPEMFMELKEPIPWGAELVGQYKTSGNIRQYLHKRFYVLGHQRIKSRTEMKVHERGDYVMHSAILSGGDFFGLHATEKTLPYVRRIVCMPQKITSPQLDKVLGGFLGDVSVRRYILPDPILTIAARDYTGREPIKDIHHAQSARQGRLMVRQYDHTLEPAVTVVLDIDITSYPPRYEKVEKCLSLARAVFEALNRAGIKFGFITNARSHYNQQWQNANDGFGKSHLNMLLAGLGCASLQARESSAELMKRSIANCETGRSHIVIMSEQKNTLMPFVRRLEAQTGGAVLQIIADDYMTEDDYRVKEFIFQRRVATVDALQGEAA